MDVGEVSLDLEQLKDLAQGIISSTQVPPLDPEPEAQVILKKAFNIPTVIERICFFTNSERDLLQLRSVSRDFQEEATKCLKTMHSPIYLKSETSVKDFMKCAIKRKRLGLKPVFPFSNLAVTLKMGSNTVEAFGPLCGPHVTTYSFRPTSSENQMTEQMRNLGQLLNFSPNVEKLELSSFCPPTMTELDEALFPMTFKNLRRIYLTYHEPMFHFQQEHPLINLLIQRSTRLDYCQLPTLRMNPRFVDDYIPDTRPLRLLFNHHPNIPRIAFDREVVACPSNLRWLDDLIEANFKLSEFAVKLKYRRENGQAFNLQLVTFLVNRMSQWLAVQTDSMESLGLTFYGPHSVLLLLPPMTVLATLELNFKYEAEYQLPPGARPVVPLTENQFPKLKKLLLHGYRDDYELFDASPLTTVEELHLRNHRAPLVRPMWTVSFPNLTTLRAELQCDAEDPAGPSVAFILRYFTRLIHLDLQFVTGPGWPFQSVARCVPDLWDILTGGAPRPLNRHAVWFGNVGQGWEPLPLPVDGVYQVPSLRNLRALKTLRFRAGMGSNLDAVTFMSTSNYLVRLDKLILDKLHDDLQINTLEVLQYENHLKRMHKKVKILLV